MVGKEGSPSSSIGGGLWRELPLGGAVPVLLIGVILGADVLEGPKTAYVGVLAFVPMLAAVFARPLITAAVGLVTWLSALSFGLLATDGNAPAQRVRLVIIAICSVIAVVASAVRSRTDRALAVARVAAAEAEVTRQQAREALEEEQRLEHERRVRVELLRVAEERLDADSSGRSPLQLLVELLVPQLADAAVVESLADEGRVLAAAGRVRTSGGTQVEQAELTSEFDAGAAGSVRLRLRRTVGSGSGDGDGDRAGFGDADRDYLDRLAHRVSVVIARRELREGQRNISWDLQHALLPTTLARVNGVDVSGAYLAAGEMLEVGGDWYDSLLMPDGRLLLVVGDVVGHSLEAAVVMARLRSGLAALSTLISRPGELLVALDAFAHSAAGDAGFATAVCAALDPRTGELEYASAGHLPMLLVEPAGSTRWLDGGRSVPLATFQPSHRPSAQDTLSQGSTLVLYTDGLIERRGEPIDEGLQRLADAAVALQQRGGRVLSQELVGELAGGQLEDDAAVLTVQIGVATPAPWSVTLPAQPATLPDMRNSAREWLDTIGVSPECVADVLLVLTEGCANAIDHAYVDQPRGSYRARMSLAATGELMVEIVDHGTWRPPGLHSAGRGRGTAVIDALSTSVRRRSDTAGTTLTILIDLSFAPTSSVAPA